MKNISPFTLIESKDEDYAVLERVFPNRQKIHSLMNITESAFLTSLILKYKPKKILEVGVSAGTSSLVLLNAMKETTKLSYFHVIILMK
jgi:predicted O-methyltransferase YrrM